MGVWDSYGAIREANISPALHPKTDKLIVKDMKRYKFWNIVKQLIQIEYNYVVSLPTTIVDLGEGYRSGPKTMPNSISYILSERNF